MAKQLTEGTRRDFEDGLLEPGEYGIGPDGIWYAATPYPIDNNDLTFALIANLSKHEVTEHTDGTITVSPSILVRSWRGVSWHGYLERGVWREV